MPQRLYAAALALVLCAGAADAKPLQQQLNCDNNGRCTTTGQVQAEYSGRRRATYDSTVIGGRPAGCPHAYCGCSASLYVFGKIIPNLNLTTNWIRTFQRTAPAGGMVAANNRHVMVLISHAGGNDWLVHDGNSGNGLTRRHIRSIASYVIVDPNSPKHRLAGI